MQGQEDTEYPMGLPYVNLKLLRHLIIVTPEQPVKFCI